ncbi:MAG: DNA-binding response regulator, partial [Clostridia bacterium]
MYKILIVEDEPGIAQSIARQVREWGYEPQCIADFRNVLAEFAAFAPHLVLLDISLPFYNGYHWCGEIRKLSKVPILFLSSASDNMNILIALNTGGDDFLAKPFDLHILTAKVQALLRRTYDFGGETSLLTHRGAVLNLRDASLCYQDARLELSKNDFKILQTLLEQKGRVVRRDTLMERLWETDSYIDDNTL